MPVACTSAVLAKEVDLLKKQLIRSISRMLSDRQQSLAGTEKKRCLVVLAVFHLRLYLKKIVLKILLAMASYNTLQ